MKRRKFLLAGGAWLISHACAGLSRQASPGPRSTLEPTLTMLQISTPTPAPVVAAERAAAPTVASTSTDAPIQAVPEASPSPAGSFYRLPIVDDFTSPAGRANLTIAMDSAGQVGFTEEGLAISGVAAGLNDPWIYSRRFVPPEGSQVAGARFKTAWVRATGWIGLSTQNGQGTAGVRRTKAEGEGGILAYGAQQFPLLNMYSNCWYDFVILREGGETAFAINDGAGLELVLVAGETDPARAGVEMPAQLGYRAEGGENQGATIQSWYALQTPAYPPALVNQAQAADDFEADLGTNAAWVEVRIERAGGNAGLRFRSLDQENEYRVYLNEAGLNVERVFEGKVTNIAKQPVAYRAGAKLAARYNELTLTVYYDGELTEVVNRRIGSAGLLAGSKVGVYATAPGSSFRQFIARPVCFSVPEELRGRLMQSRQVLCLGDSLTNADMAYGYQNRLRKRLGDGWVTVDCGVSSQTTYQMRTRLPVHLRRYTPEVVVVLGGTNDIDMNAQAGEIQANLQAIYRTVKQSGQRVVAVTIPPRGNSVGWTEEKQAVLEAVNAWIRGASNAASAIDCCIDAYELLKDTDGDSLQNRYDGGDGVHLGPEGYGALGDEIFTNVSW